MMKMEGETMMKTRYTVKHASGLFLCMALIVLCSQAWAAQQTAEQTVILARERADVVIDAKGPDEITLERHEFKNLDQNRLEVPYNPMIFDVGGRAIQLKDLKTPCDAVIEYKWVRGKDPELIRLEVQKYGDNATAIFTLPKKKKKLPM
jgi:hypothetical protein